MTTILGFVLFNWITTESVSVFELFPHPKSKKRQVTIEIVKDHFGEDGNFV